MTVRMANSEVNGVSVMALDGRIALGEESNSLREKLKSLVAEGKKKIVLNMANVAYIDSLDRDAARADGHGGKMSHSLFVLYHSSATDS